MSDYYPSPCSESSAVTDNSYVPSLPTLEYPTPSGLSPISLPFTQFSSPNPVFPNEDTASSELKLYLFFDERKLASLVDKCKIPWYGSNSIRKLAPNLLATSFDYLDQCSIVKFGMTCRQAQSFVMSYFLRRIGEMVKHFEIDPTQLLESMSSYDAVISGDYASLAFQPAILSRNIAPSELVFNVHRNSARDFVNRLMDLGEFGLVSDTIFYAEDGSRYKRKWHIRHRADSKLLHKDIYIVSFADDSLHPPPAFVPFTVFPLLL